MSVFDFVNLLYDLVLCDTSVSIYVFHNLLVCLYVLLFFSIFLFFFEIKFFICMDLGVQVQLRYMNVLHSNKVWAFSVPIT